MKGSSDVCRTGLSILYYIDKAETVSDRAASKQGHSKD